MRGAAASSLVSKITASLRNGSIRLNGIEAMPSSAMSRERTFGDRLASPAPPTGAPMRSRARPFDLSRKSTWPGKIRWGFLTCSRFMPQSSGQRHGLFRYSLEMPQSVSWRLTV